MKSFTTFATLAVATTCVDAFTQQPHSAPLSARATYRRSAPTPLNGVIGGNNDYGWGVDVVRKQERAARAAEAGDVVVEVTKPLGVVLEEDKNGDVFVAEVTPGGNGDKVGLKRGLQVQMVSATFGNEMWNARGTGLDRVLKAIKVRIGTSVTLVVADQAGVKKTAKRMAMSAEKRAAQEAAAQAKRDALLREVQGERKEAAKKWFGLF